MKYLLIFASLLATPATYAGDKTGNGGDVLMVNGKPHLLDLVEAGLENTAQCNPLPDTKLIKRFQEMIGDQARLPQDLVDCYLSKLTKYSEYEQSMFVVGLAMYQIRFVSTELQDIQDEYSSLEFDPKNIKQVAIRKDLSILINRALFKQLSLPEQAGLLLHEITYAFLRPFENASGVLRQESWQARQIVGSIFDSKFVPLSRFTARGTPVLSFIDRNYEYTKPKRPVSSMGDGTDLSKWYVKSELYLQVKDNINTPRGPHFWMIMDANLFDTRNFDERQRYLIKHVCEFSLEQAQDLKVQLELTSGVSWWDHMIQFKDLQNMKVLSTEGTFQESTSMAAQTADGRLITLEEKKIQIKTKEDCKKFEKLIEEQLKILNQFDLYH